MINSLSYNLRGYTVVELMVTIVIVSGLAATLGALFVKLLTLQEMDREEAYIKERLVDICGNYADYLSVGSSISSNEYNTYIATYRRETGGVSFETGRVSRVAQLMSLNTISKETGLKTIDLNACENIGTQLVSKFARTLRGDDLPLININDLKELTISDDKINIYCSLTPVNANEIEDSALCNLAVVAQYEAIYDKGERTNKTVRAERVVRLWNRE